MMNRRWRECGVMAREKRATSTDCSQWVCSSSVSTVVPLCRLSHYEHISNVHSYNCNKMQYATGNMCFLYRNSLAFDASHATAIWQWVIIFYLLMHETPYHLLSLSSQSTYNRDNFHKDDMSPNKRGHHISNYGIYFTDIKVYLFFLLYMFSEWLKRCKAELRSIQHHFFFKLYVLNLRLR